MSPSRKYSPANSCSRRSSWLALSGAIRKGSPLAGSETTLSRELAACSVRVCDSAAAAQPLGVAPAARVQQRVRLRRRTRGACCGAVPDVAHGGGDLGGHRSDQTTRAVVIDQGEQLDARGALDRVPVGIALGIALLLRDLVGP